MYESSSSPGNICTIEGNECNINEFYSKKHQYYSYLQRICQNCLRAAQLRKEKQGTQCQNANQLSQMNYVLSQRERACTNPHKSYLSNKSKLNS